MPKRCPSHWTYQANDDEVKHRIDGTWNDDDVITVGAVTGRISVPEFVDGCTVCLVSEDHFWGTVQRSPTTGTMLIRESPGRRRPRRPSRSAEPT